ncbi:MAG: DUF1080 domain-containing protein [Verrucomicrobiota bacterium]|nr:DUF1080 domain-containing protein [Verrucomicrobiota bacterium]
MTSRLLPLFALALALLSTTRLLGADADFKPIFNGKDLANWEGDSRLWSVKDGAIRGETALPDKMTIGNTFLIWRGGVLKDFELKVKFRIQNGNSGIQYRSKELPKWVVSGYQAEIENKQGKVGFLYHEKGRKYLANVGEIVAIGEDGKPKVVGQIAPKEDYIKKGYYKEKDWNEYVIIGRGNHLEHSLNGFKTIELTDNDPAGRALEGILALQIHAGPPMVVEFKDILLKNL